MRDHLDRLSWLDRFSPGGLALTGLALIVLSVFAAPLSGPGTQALAVAAVAFWLAAVALWVLRSPRFERERNRDAVAGLLGAFALLFALVASASAVKAVGFGSNDGSRPQPPAEQVAGATETAGGARGTKTASTSLKIASPTPPAGGSAFTPLPVPSSGAGASAAASDSGAAAASPSASTAALRSGPVRIAFTSLTSPVSPGDQAVASVQATPGSLCSIRIGYPGGNTAAGSSPQIVPDSGTASWNWTVDPGTASGQYAVRVTCRSTDSSAWWTRSLFVR